ncbi:tannase and feruloyl esterase-domain-containing protein [Fusarium oxysporum]|nr:tannase and feruloyl esterase-domain-containing protein [Fusarium oxysporum]
MRQSFGVVMALLSSPSLASSLSELCTLSNLKAALPSNGTLLGIDMIPSTITVSTAVYNASAGMGGGPMRRDTDTYNYCNVTVAYTHGTKGDTVNLKYAFPNPENFKNRFYVAGGGGYSLNTDTTGGLKYGAAAGATDGGYDAFNYSLDEKFLLGNGSINWDATYMFSYQALGEMTQIGKYITKNLYDMSKSSKVYTYYEGCSDGGREGMSQVQRWGDEYDGVIAGAPAFRFAQQQVLHVYPAAVEQTLDYYPPPCELKKIVNATIEACDALDGRKDGVISRTDLCKIHFNLKSLIGKEYYCAAETSSSLGFGFSKRQAPGSQMSNAPEQNGTITAEGIAVARAIYDGVFNSKDERAYLSWQIGSELSDGEPTYDNKTDKWTLNIPSTGGMYVAKFIELLELDNLENLNNVTYDTLVDWMDTGMVRYYDSLQTTHPDLTTFKEAGGKLLHYHGESDPSIPAGSSVHYWQSVRSIMYPKLSDEKAQKALSEWYQFYLVPGAAHCGTNSLQPGPYPQNNMNIMIDWVENGKQPSRLNATVSSGDYKGETQMLCQWPKRPLWKNDKSFACVDDEKSIESWTYSFNAFKIPAIDTTLNLTWVLQARAPRTQRSRGGCQTCRVKKVKCDETRPICRRCIRLELTCDYTRLPRKKYTRRVIASPVVSSPANLTASADAASTPITSFTAPGDHPYSGEAYCEGFEGGPLSDTQSADISLPPLNTIADDGLALELSPDCAAILFPSDHSAIHFFRFVLPGMVGTRISMHSGPGLVWKLAQQSPMVLHMVCAVSGQSWSEKTTGSESDAEFRRLRAIQHYRDGLQMLAAATQIPSEITYLPPVLATLWLMLLYELKFGDGCGIGFDAHLRGATSILLGRSQLASSESSEHHVSHIIEAESFCSVSCKILIWLSHADGGAVLNGFGGAFNNLLGDSSLGMSESEAQDRLERVRRLQKRSVLANYDLWGRSYPQTELLEDLQCSDLSCFDAESAQLKFMVGALAAAEYRDNVPHGSWRQSVAGAILNVRSRYGELISVANRLELPDDGPHRRFVMEMQSVVSCFHAIFVCFLRITHGQEPMAPEQREAMKEIMSLAFKVYRDQGETGLARLGWPLFVVAIESDDILHRSWVLERFGELASHGENYRQAYQAIRVAVADLYFHLHFVFNITILQIASIMWSPTGIIGPFQPKSSRLTVMLLVASAAVYATTAGYDSALMSGINIIPSYTEFLNLNTTTRALNVSANFIGWGIASLTMGPVVNAIGRKNSILVALLTKLFSIGLVAGSQNFAMFLSGRIILGVASGLSSIAGSTWLAETLPPKIRGLGLSITFSVYYVGALISAGITYRTAEISGEWSWRLPILLQSMFSLICIFCLFLTPESPRWLSHQDMLEESLQVIASISANGDQSNQEVREQYQGMIDSRERERSEGKTASYTELFTTRSARRRLMLAVSVAVIVMASGNNIASFFLGDMLTNAGITNRTTQLQINIVLQSWCLACAMLGTFLMDRAGRKTLCLSACVGMAILMFVIGALTKTFSTSQDLAGIYGTVACIFLFMGAYSVGITPITQLYPPEVLSYSIRTNGMAIWAGTIAIFAIGTTLVFPIALEAISWRLYFIIGAWDVLETIFVAEIDELFEGVVYNGQGVSEVREDGIMTKDQDGKDRSVSIARSATE